MFFVFSILLQTIEVFFTDFAASLCDCSPGLIGLRVVWFFGKLFTIRDVLLFPFGLLLLLQLPLGDYVDDISFRGTLVLFLLFMMYFSASK